MNSVDAWLLEADPALRWQVLQDLTDAPAEQVAHERARVETEGWGRHLLTQQAPDGRWGGATWNRGWNSTMHALTLLRELGLDPTGEGARNALARVRAHVTWRGCGPEEVADHRFFEGETEPCVNGQVAAAGAYFREDVQPLIRRLVSEQMPDGGWNCEAHRARHSSFNTTICVLEALLEYERAGGRDPGARAARLRGEDYLLDRRMFRRLSTGEAIERDRKGGAAWVEFAFPNWWHYDVLRGLDYLRRAGASPDARVAQAVHLLASKRDVTGRWRLDVAHAGAMLVDLTESPGAPSRWITLRALRVLRWYARDRAG